MRSVLVIFTCISVLWQRRGLMLVRPPPDRAVPVRTLARTFSCVLEQDTTLALPLSAQEYKWVLVLHYGNAGGNPATG